MLQLALLDPWLAILDETDSGMDVRTLHLLVKMIQRKAGEKKAFLIITHSLAWLKPLKINAIHMIQGGTLQERIEGEAMEKWLRQGHANKEM